jgi:hypothetical protein
MKVLMYNWAYEKMNLPAWFKHQEEAEISWSQIEQLYASGINVMLFHAADEHVLYVDNKRFTQR